MQEAWESLRLDALAAVEAGDDACACEAFAAMAAIEHDAACGVLPPVDALHLALAVARHDAEDGDLGSGWNIVQAALRALEAALAATPRLEPAV